MRNGIFGDQPSRAGEDCSTARAFGDQLGYNASRMIPNASMPALPADTLPEVAELYAYWASLPKLGLMPLLSDYLNHAPPRQQPFIAMVDIYSPTKMKVRLMGTGLVELSGRDATGADLRVLYAEGLEARVGSLGWSVVSRPVGYLGIRTVRTTSGRVVEGSTISLPLANPTSTINVGLTYFHVSDVESRRFESDKAEFVQDFMVKHWIDLGAGVPHLSI